MVKNKIMLPWVEDDIKAEKKRAQKAREYWELCQSWNGRAANITVQTAISKANKIMEGLDPNTKIFHKTGIILSKIVEHGTKRSPKQSKEAAKIVIM